MAELDALIAAVRALDARFNFDLEGRPGAIAAVRMRCRRWSASCSTR
jgi:hypothetical protein